MTVCRCTNRTHARHLGEACEAIATEADGLCRRCHDEAAEPVVKSPRIVEVTPR